MTRHIPALGTAVALLIAGLSVGLAGCRSAKIPVKYDKKISVVGMTDMNKGGNTAYVHFYLLTDDDTFISKPVETFWRDDEVALGSDLLETRRQVVFPGDTVSVDLTILPEARYVGVAANLREPAQNEWRELFQIDDIRFRDVEVRVGTDRIVVMVSGVNVK